MEHPKTVAEAVADVVARNSPVVFSLIGNGNAHFVASLTSRGHRVVDVRHETATVAAAHSFALAGGGVAAASATYGAGFTNLLTSLAEARLTRVPAVVIVGTVPTSGPRAIDIDQLSAAAAVYVRTLVVSVRDAAAQTEAAYEIARRDRVPVIVAIPYDLVDAPATSNDPVAVPPAEEVLRAQELTAADPVSRSAAFEVAGILQRADRPLILAGRGAVISQAGDALRELGDRVGALFASSLMAHGVVESPWDLGIAGGFSTPATADLFKQADVVLVVGASMNLWQMRYDSLLADDARVIQVDTLSAPTHPRVDAFHRADARTFALTVLDSLPAVERAGWRADVVMPTHDAAAFDELASDGRLDPRAVMDRLETILPAERTITQDNGHFMGWAPRHLSAPDPDAMLLPGLGLHCIGLGAGSLIGVAAARTDRLPVLVTGDGGFLMELSELDTLVREVESALVIVMNDAAFGMEVHQYGARGLDTSSMRFSEVDFSELAKAMGARGAKIRSLAQLASITEWLTDGAPGIFVADVAISPEVIADWLLLSNRYNGVPANEKYIAGAAGN